MELTHEDMEALAKLRPKLDLVRDRVRSVVDQLATGFYLFGEGGMGKSYTVFDELQKLKANYVVHSARMTGRGLVDVLDQFPDAIHVLEDCETLFDDRRAWGVLRSALWSQSKKRPPEREITWNAFQTQIRFTFTGGIILIANKDVDNIPELRAVKTRISTLQFIASFDEIAALMRHLAVEGYTYGAEALAPAETWRVTEYVIDKYRALNRTLDMRVQRNGFHDYLQWKNGRSKTDWQELIETRIRETTITRLTRSERVQQEVAIALEIDAMDLSRTEKLQLWKQRTDGKSERAYYRRLQDAAAA